jgi:hypothetical protein
MLQLLIQLLIYATVFAVMAFGLYWVCTRFFPNFPPALWICGAVLLIIILVFVSGQLGGGASVFPVLRK